MNLRRRHGRSSRGLAAATLALALAVLSATGTIEPSPGFPQLGEVAQARAVSTVVPDAPPPPETPLPPGATQPSAISVAVGPNLNVPILYYHYIRSIAPTPQNLLGFRLSISPQLFAQQMALLHVEGAHTVTISTLVAALAGHAELPPHPVVLTFDDGYADFATAAEPVLVRYGFVATDFVVSGFLGRRSYMTAAQVLAMDAAGMVIGSHTVHHVDLARVSLLQARAEIDSGKAALEQLLGHPVLDFAYPYGGLNAAVVQLVQQAGFRDAVSTMFGDTRTMNGRFLFHRTEIGGILSLTTFARDAGLQPPAPSQSSLIASLIGPPPSLLSA